jgi:hypothetical protein
LAWFIGPPNTAHESMDSLADFVQRKKTDSNCVMLGYFNLLGTYRLTGDESCQQTRQAVPAGVRGGRAREVCGFRNSDEGEHPRSDPVQRVGKNIRGEIGTATC